MKFSSTGSSLFPQWVCYRDAIRSKVAATNHLSLMLFCTDTEGFKPVWSQALKKAETSEKCDNIHRRDWQPRSCPVDP